MAIGVRDRVLWQAAVALVALVVGVVVADAAAVVEVYRMIQYDLRGVPLGSRRAAMNHHASSNLAVPGSDLSRTVIILPIAEANITMLNGAYALASETSSAVVVSSFFFFFFSPPSLSLSLRGIHFRFYQAGSSPSLFYHCVRVYGYFAEVVVVMAVPGAC
jgi:hypothetical protein